MFACLKRCQQLLPKPWSRGVMGGLVVLAAGTLIGCEADNKPKPWDGAAVHRVPVAPDDVPVSDSNVPIEPDAAYQPADPAFDSLTGYSGQVTAILATWPSIPNAGMQLPRLSPDGKWLAFQTLADGAAVPSLDDLIRGRRLGALSLHVRGLKDKGLGQTVATGGASWPAWTADGRHLVYVVNDPATGGAALGRWTVGDATPERKAVGLKHLVAPAMSPDGRTVAVSAFGEVPEQMVLFVVDWQTGRAEPGPPALGKQVAQVAPQWLGPGQLVYIEVGAERCRLMRWQVGSPQAQPLVDLPIAPNVYAATLAFMGVVEPVSPGLDHLAFFDHQHGGVAIQALTGGKPQPLGGSMDGPSQSAAWMAHDWLAVAGKDSVKLVRTRVDDPSDNQDDTLEADDRTPKERVLRLIHGTWAVVHGDPAGQSLLLVGPAKDDPTRFVPVQLWVVADATP